MHTHGKGINIHLNLHLWKKAERISVGYKDDETSEFATTHFSYRPFGTVNGIKERK